MRIRGDTAGVEHTIAGFKQGGHFIIPTYRASKGEKFEVKKPSSGTTNHKNKTLLAGNYNSKKQNYELGLKKLEQYKDNLKKLENDKNKALGMMAKHMNGTEEYENLKVIAERRTDKI